MVLLMLSAKPSPKSILSYYASELPDDLEEFDVTIKRFFTDKATNIMKSQSDVYRYINPSKNTPHFYELLRKKHSHLYFLQFRVVKIKTTENTQEIYSRLILYNFGIFIANEAAEENRKKKRDTPYAQIIDSILIYGNFSSGLLDKSFL